MNAQEVDVYAALSGGLYRYDAARHILEMVSATDVRRVTGYQDFVDQAPLDLVYVAHHGRLKLVPAASAIPTPGSRPARCRKTPTCIAPARACPLSSARGSTAARWRRRWRCRRTNRCWWRKRRTAGERRQPHERRAGPPPSKLAPQCAARRFSIERRAGPPQAARTAVRSTQVFH